MSIQAYPNGTLKKVGFEFHGLLGLLSRALQVAPPGVGEQRIHQNLRGERVELG
jgi:hypothetical protein